MTSIVSSTSTFRTLKKSQPITQTRINECQSPRNANLLHWTKRIAQDNASKNILTEGESNGHAGGHAGFGHAQGTRVMVLVLQGCETCNILNGEKRHYRSAQKQASSVWDDAVSTGARIKAIHEPGAIHATWFSLMRAHEALQRWRSVQCLALISSELCSINKLMCQSESPWKLAKTSFISTTWHCILAWMSGTFADSIRYNM